MASNPAWWSWPRRIIVSLVGGTLVLIGCALIFLPGPAFVVIPVGLAILGIEFVWARRWMLKLSRKVGVEVENPVRKHRKVLILFFSLAAVLLLARLALPYLVRERINDGLAEMGEYSGHVADVDLALLLGAYSLNDLRLVKRGGEFEEDFADIPTLDLSIQWSALFDGGLVGLVAKLFENPPEDQVATQIPLSGELQNPDADLLATLVNLARNAFVAALTRFTARRLHGNSSRRPSSTSSGPAQRLDPESGR